MHGSSPARAVTARGLCKSYGGAVAVRDLDIEVEAGTIHGLLGPNGAGKTTLLAMLFGLVPPDAGHLEVLGRRPRGGPSDLDGVGGFVEAPHFYPYLDGRTNLLGLAGLDGGIDGGVDEGLVDRLLGEVGLGSAGGLKVRGYSLGMRQRLGLAAALLRRPALLVLDEPANGLDPAGRRDLSLLLRRLAGEGATVVLSSHDMATVEQLCDRVTCMCAGEVVFDGTMEAMRGRAPDPDHAVHTSDDAAAVVHAVRMGVAAEAVPDGGLSVRAGEAAIDDWVIALGRAGIAVRSMALTRTPLEALFLDMTDPGRHPA